MADKIRSFWTGRVLLGKVDITVSAKPVVDADPKRIALKPLCSCHKQPFSQSKSCPGGKAPWSAAAEKRGDKNLTDVVHGVKTDDDDYVLVEEEVLEEIDEQFVFDDLQIEEVVAPASADERGFPLHLSKTAYYLAADKDDVDQQGRFAALHEALSESGEVAVGRWSPRGGEKLVGIHAVGPALVASVVPHGEQVREPDAEVLAHSRLKVDPDDLQAVETILGALGTSAFDHDAYENEAETERAHAIEDALKAAKAGRKPKVKKVAKPAATKRGGSLTGLLADSIKEIEAKKGAKPVKKSAAKPKTAAKPKKTAAKPKSSRKTTAGTR